MSSIRIIDFRRVGNVVRFYFGDVTADYWGDDWDDAPYDCNAGTVYDEFITGSVDAAWPLSCEVLEPASLSYNNCPYTKDDMRHKVTPCIIVDDVDAYGQGNGNRSPIFFGDGIDRITSCGGTILAKTGAVE